MKYWKTIFVLFSFLLTIPAAQAGDITADNKTDFGAVYSPDEAPQTNIIKLKRMGGNPVITINSVTAFGGANPGDFTLDLDECTGAELPGPCDLTISFSPTGFFERSATVTVNASGAANTVPPGDTEPVTSGDFVFEVTGVGEGCGDGIRQAAFETCDFENPNSAGCCDNSCEAANEGGDCTAGGCIVGGACATGFCEGGTDEPEGTPCDDNNQCITGEACNGSGECVGGEPVVCPEPAECKVAAGCDPLQGCVENNAAEGTACGVPGSGDVCDGSGNCVAPGANLSITKSPNPNPVACGTNVLYTITVTNNGPGTADNVQVTDTVPDGLSVISVVASQGGCNDTVPPVCNLGSLASGASATIEVTVQTTAEGTIVNTATVQSDQSGPISTDASLDVQSGTCPTGGDGCALSSQPSTAATQAWGFLIACAALAMIWRLRRSYN